MSKAARVGTFHRYNTRMANDRRRFWTTLIFILLLAPVVVTLLLTLFTPAPTVAPATRGSPGGPFASLFPPSNSAAPSGPPANAPLHAASDGRNLWVAYPRQVEDKDGKIIPVFELLRRAGNTGIWARSTHHAALWRNFPQSLAVQPMPPAGKAFVPGAAYVFSEGGGVERYTIDSQSAAENLPAGQIVKATVGALEGVFALALGPVPTTATRPGDRVRPDADYFSLVDPFGTMMGGGVPGPSATATAPATTPPTAPATSPALPATSSALTPPPPATGPESRPPPPPAGSFNAFWLRENRWTLLPGLGQASGDPTLAPTPSSHVAMVVTGNTEISSAGRAAEASTGAMLVAMWVDPTRSGTLFVRTLALGTAQGASGWGGATWSPVMNCELPEQVPAVSRLYALTIEGKICVLWTVPTGSTVELHGGILVTRAAALTAPAGFTLNTAKLARMSLGEAGQGISLANDVAVGASENSLLAVVSTSNGLASLVFDDRGRLMSPPAAVQPKSLVQDVRIGQNIAMIILVLVFSLSLWQWRQKPITMAIPEDMTPAPLSRRGAAFLIDAALPFLAVVTAFGELGEATSILAAWFGTTPQPAELMHLPELFVFLALFVTHGAVGELIFGRSVGKALVGLRVLMIDGKPPTLAAVLLRNLIRLPELAIGFVILYVLISEHRQRLGDLLARTVVVTRKPVELSDDEAPPDPPKG